MSRKIPSDQVTPWYLFIRRILEAADQIDQRQAERKNSAQEEPVIQSKRENNDK